MSNTIKKIGVVLFLGMLLFSCGSRRSTVRTHKTKDNKPEQIVIKDSSKDIQETKEVETTSKVPMKTSSTEAYLTEFAPIAQEEMRLYGIPASITLAQGILESNSGKGRLSIEANNHFGIKCHDWTGAKIYHDDDKLQECFRKYNDAKYSYRDHSLFLTTRKRYAKLFDLDKDDYKGWAKELKAAGYATDKKYPDKLISLIERYELYELDDEVINPRRRRKKEIPEKEFAVIEKKDSLNAVSKVDTTKVDTTNVDTSVTKKEVQVVNSLKDTVFVATKELPEKTVVGDTIHTVGEGDTLYSISKKYNLTMKEIQEMNGLTDTAINLGQELKVKSETNKNIYIVEKGDTLYSISKKYNTTVQTLQQLNGLNDTAINIGQELVVK